MKLLRGLVEVRLADDGVATVYSLGLVARHEHGHTARHSGPLKVSDGGAAQIVEESPRHPSRPCGLPVFSVEARPTTSHSPVESWSRSGH
jgi:hypothetical protein